jgi:polysaccharide deacetylase family protein (PEP-CTERM system associated)
MVQNAPFTGVRNALSVDVEDWFQVGAFETVIDRKDWDALDRRVERNTDAVLHMFDEASVKATFFTLAWVAERHPALIRRIVDAGHETASHGIDHKRVFHMDRAEFLSDLKHSKTVLEQASGQAVNGYRAPSFSIDPRTPWAHEALVEAGYTYSSSVAPVVHDHYGWPDAPRFGWNPVPGADFIEIPVTTAKFAGRTLAAGGGGFFRLLPYGFSKWAINQVNGEGRPAVIYFHPWEIDPDQPRVANAPVKSKLRHYTNLSVMAPKLKRLASDFGWERLDAIVAREKGKLQ